MPELVQDCILGELSPNTISSVVKAFTDCDSLEYLDISCNSFSAAATALIVDGLAQLQSLRYLALDVPEQRVSKLCKKYHDAINQYRKSPIHISYV